VHTASFIRALIVEAVYTFETPDSSYNTTGVLYPRKMTSAYQQKSELHIYTIKM
jgi:hypothetical protein